MKHIFNNNILKERRQELRHLQTSAEKLLWEKLRKRQINGIKFFRQYSVGPYILDFYSPLKKCAVELDGLHHNEELIASYDQERTDYLNNLSIKVLRFWNDDIYTRLENVLQIIESQCDTPPLNIRGGWGEL